MGKWGWPGSEIILDNPVVEGDFTLRQHIRSVGRVGIYLSEPLFTTTFSVSVDQVPSSLLTIPVMATLVPVAWVEGARLIVPEVDKTFFAALETVKNVLAKYFPGLPLNGEIIPEKIIDNSKASLPLRRGLLFSGGVDSTATLLRRCEERPILITIQGSDIKLDSISGWEKVKRGTVEIGHRYSLDSVNLSSNFRQIINYKALNYHYGSTTLGWWEGVHSSLGLAGLCAPLTWAMDIGKLYMASCEGTILPWNSHAGVVENTSWGTTRVEWEGKELMRQAKIEIIADRIKSGEKDLKLRVCYETQSGDNCGHCKKCALTALGMLLEGVNPSDHGLSFKPEDLETYRRKIEDKVWDIRLNRGSWKRLQQTIPKKRNVMVPFSTPFFSWLAQMDIDSVASRSELTPAQRFKAFRKKYLHDPYFIFRRYLRAWLASAIYFFGERADHTFERNCK